mgnify:CR=1 FL=1
MARNDYQTVDAVLVGAKTGLLVLLGFGSLGFLVALVIAIVIATAGWGIIRRQRPD